MTVRPLRDRRYVVETDGGTYVVALDAGTCTCPDHAIRGSRCKHLRRVAMEVTAGSVPAPDERVGACAVCGAETVVPFDAGGAHLCDRHAFEPGAAVRDRETGKRLVVVEVTTERADAFRTDEGRTVAEYATNADYGAHEPVVEAVYAESLRPGRRVADCDRYGFPASRLTSAP
ncbi:SWIM zinc finger family protein [Halorubrum amylolyticum]|uniref:SWIM zinc finger family protein n=1 Tax=Halorubrum amylolyticum TaxID=2508724 RepID=UPI001009383C|nr:SWIM zinc finger family protein [Halorubrum amylolyticum]